MKKQNSILKSFLYSLTCATVLTGQLFGSEGNTALEETKQFAAMLHQAFETQKQPELPEAQLAGIELMDKRYVQRPLEWVLENSCYKAPEHVQELARTYAQCMDRQDLFQSYRDPLPWLELPYFKTMGFLTVYEKDIAITAYIPNEEDFFTRAVSLGRGGIFFKPGSFSLDRPLTTEQRVDLCHEVAHIMNGDTTMISAPDDNMTEKMVWFKHEYLAQRKAAEVLYKLEDYEALEYLVVSSLFIPLPYGFGAFDGFLAELAQHPDDIHLQAIVQNLEERREWQDFWKSQQDQAAQATWQTRYEFCKERWPEEFEEEQTS